MEQVQIHACETLLSLEDMYLEKLSESDDREQLEPLRTCIGLLREVYKIETETLIEYDKYIRMARMSAIYGDINDDIEESNTEDGPRVE